MTLRIEGVHALIDAYPWPLYATSLLLGRMVTNYFDPIPKLAAKTRSSIIHHFLRVTLPENFLFISCFFFKVIPKTYNVTCLTDVSLLVSLGLCGTIVLEGV